ncbi:MAG: tRNA adenosine(34) deaminase TadA [Deltaproteobacteria bacterium]|nr:tRNA adenosine(34) deaminase TadA [Deltaproteobacteria bacterium]
MAIALEEAKVAAQQGEVPAGAAVSDAQGHLIASGQNRVTQLCDPTAHAEIEALRAAGAKIGNYRLVGTVLASTLEPCPMCLMAAVHARVSLIFFGAPEPKWGAAGSVLDLLSIPGLNHRPEILGGIMANECAEIIKEFFKKRRA